MSEDNQSDKMEKFICKYPNSEDIEEALDRDLKLKVLYILINKPVWSHCFVYFVY